MAGASDFVHLHLHTEYSLLDGASRPVEVAKRAAQWNMEAVALTDHGSLFGVVPFYTACKANGVKPIIGVESYILARGSRLERVRAGRGEAGKELCHFTLLCENETGYRNLLKIVSDSWLNGFYYKPRMDRELLAGHTEGLIAMSACLGGEIPQAILEGRGEQAKRVALEYRELFGPDNFFLELMDHHTPEQHKVNAALYELSRETGIPLVCTNDVHYVEESDAEPQDLLLCIGTGCVHGDPKRMRMSSRELWMRSAEQMWQVFGDVPDALLRTRQIAERCNVELKFGQLYLPEFPNLPPGETEGGYLRRLCLERFGRFYGPERADARQRLDYELEIIDRKGFSGYYLIVWDLIDHAKQNGIRIGPGRGSGAGSIAAYVLGITELDPLAYNLLFERFLNPERPSAPDFDIDIPPERRDEVVAYTIARYGVNRTAKIITFGTLGAKAALKDVGRVLEVPIADVNELTALVPDKVGTNLDDALEQCDELRRRYDQDPQVRGLIDHARRLEGLSRHTSVHAAALVISRDDLDNYVPLCRVSGGEDIVTQFDMGAVDKCGLLKMDFLGLRTMTVVDECCRLVAENHGLDGFDVRDVPLDDKRTYDLISRGDVVGVFQLESGGFQKVCRELKPDCIEDIVALVALYRPGPMENIGEFVARKHGQNRIVYKHPLLEPILRPTYGIIVYQEQVMQIGRDLGGFSLGEADQIRKAVGKKDAATMAKVREQFIAGSAAQGITSRLANELMDEIEAFANYAFNKAHSACYAVIAYWTAYLKANYPHEFMAAQLTSVMDKRDKLITFVQDTRAMGIAVHPPCVNTGGVNFEVHEDHIVYGLAAINGVGEHVGRAIVEAREADGEFADLFDLCRRVDAKVLPKAALEKLIKAGALRALGNRRELLTAYEGVHEAGARGQEDARAGQGNLFDGLDDGPAGVFAPTLKPMPEFRAEELRALDVELLGLVLFEDPGAEIRKQLEGLGLEDSVTPVLALCELAKDTEVIIAGAFDECRGFSTKRGDAMRARLSDSYGLASVLLWSRACEQYGHLCQVGEVAILVGKYEGMDDRAGLPSVIVEQVLRPKDWQRKRRKPPRAVPEERAEAAAPGDRSNGRHGAAAAPPTPTPLPPPPPLLVSLQVPHGEIDSEDLRARLARLAETLRRHHGPQPVRLVLDDGAASRQLSLTSDFAAEWSTQLRAAIEKIEGCTAAPAN
jgi:DNA polymerase-3 subunit alpha